MAQFTNQAQLRYGNSIANSNIAVGRTAGGIVSKQDRSQKDIWSE